MDVADYIQNYNSTPNLYPGKYYSQTLELYRPLLCVGTEEYCKHLICVPHWCWNLLQHQASEFIKDSPQASPEQVVHWKSMVNGVIPYFLYQVFPHIGMMSPAN